MIALVTWTPSRTLTSAEDHPRLRWRIGSPETLVLYRKREFESFAAVIRQYVDATREDEMLHRGVVRAVNGLVEYLQSERKRVPDEVLLEAERLECLLFLGYDPDCDGDEPPGL